MNNSIFVLFYFRDGKSYHEGHCMSGHENFISAICIMPPSDKYQQGLIITGSNDHKINAYSLDSPRPVFTLTGHENTGKQTFKVRPWLMNNSLVTQYSLGVFKMWLFHRDVTLL